MSSQSEASQITHLLDSDPGAKQMKEVSEHSTPRAQNNRILMTSLNKLLVGGPIAEDSKPAIVQTPVDLNKPNAHAEEGLVDPALESHMAEARAKLKTLPPVTIPPKSPELERLLNELVENTESMRQGINHFQALLASNKLAESGTELDRLYELSKKLAQISIVARRS